MNVKNSHTKKKIVLHVGLHKTASTSIQEILAQSRHSLKKQGWSYPLYSDGNKKGITNHSNLLYTLFEEQTNSYIPNLKSGLNKQALHKRFKIILMRELESNYNIILSGEDVCAMSQASLHALAKILEPYELTVIALVRETYSHLCSNLQQRIHRGVHGLEIEVPNLSQNCSRLKEAFPNIKFYSYERVKAQKDGFSKLFSTTCNITIKPSNKRIWNESLGNKTIRFLAEFNNYFPLLIEGNKLNPDRPSFNVRKIDIDSNKFLLTETEFLTVAKEIRIENANLRDCTGLKNIRIARPIPFADDSALTWTEAMDLLTKTSMMPSALAHRALIYVLQQKVGFKAYRFVRPCLNILLFRYQSVKWIKTMISRSSATQSSGH